MDTNFIVYLNYIIVMLYNDNDNDNDNDNNNGSWTEHSQNKVFILYHSNHDWWYHDYPLSIQISHIP